MSSRASPREPKADEGRVERSREFFLRHAGSGNFNPCSLLRWHRALSQEIARSFIILRSPFATFASFAVNRWPLPARFVSGHGYIPAPEPHPPPLSSRRASGGAARTEEQRRDPENASSTMLTQVISTRALPEFTLQNWRVPPESLGSVATFPSSLKMQPGATKACHAPESKRRRRENAPCSPPLFISLPHTTCHPEDPQIRFHHQTQDRLCGEFPEHSDGSEGSAPLPLGVSHVAPNAMYKNRKTGDRQAVPFLSPFYPLVIALSSDSAFSRPSWLMLSLPIRNACLNNSLAASLP